jgi:hypothetical protein
MRHFEPDIREQSRVGIDAGYSGRRAPVANWFLLLTFAAFASDSPSSRCVSDYTVCGGCLDLSMQHYVPSDIDRLALTAAAATEVPCQGMVAFRVLLPFVYMHNIFPR